MENTEHLLWIPSSHVLVFGNWGVSMYDGVTTVAIVGGAVFWWLTTRTEQMSWFTKLLVLGAVGVITVICTKLFHMLFWGFEQSMAHPGLWLRMDGGRSVHGAFVGFGLSGLVVAKTMKVTWYRAAAPLMLWALLGLVCARVGNFWNSEMVGTETQWITGVRFYFVGDHGTIIRHPVQLYEAVLTVALLTAMWFIRHRPTLMVPLVVMGYSIIRFCCDFIKIEPGFLLPIPLSTGQLLSLVFFLGAAALLVGQHCRRAGKKADDR